MEKLFGKNSLIFKSVFRIPISTLIPYSQFVKILKHSILKKCNRVKKTKAEKHTFS